MNVGGSSVSGSPGSPSPGSLPSATPSAATYPPTFRADVEFSPSGPRVRLLGRCTAETSTTITSALEAACFSNPRRLTVDLNSVDYIDGAVMAALLEFRGTVTGTVVTLDVRHLPGSQLMDLMDSAHSLKRGQVPSSAA